jgi:hypothetical protein
LTVGELLSDSWQEEGMFRHSTASRPALGPTEPPIIWVLVDPLLDVQRQRPEADNSPIVSAAVKKGGAIPPLPHTSSWRGVKLSTWTALPFLCFTETKATILRRSVSLRVR